ncbi:MAG: hypothetical protein H6739_26860 [Alphaproteobacteria bacterium]|nr:hypothetical protein [Alphaproteobacteria bacterium]
MSLLLTAFTGLALAAAPPPYPATLVGALSVTGGPDSLGSIGTGRALIHFAPVSLDLAGGEGYLGLSPRHVGSVFVGARRYLPVGLYARGGFYHQHETDWQRFLSDPGPILAGVGDGINHRSGLQIAFGYEYAWARIIPDGFYGRLRSGVELSVAIMPDQRGPWIYASLDFTNGIDVGRRRDTASSSSPSSPAP